MSLFSLHKHLVCDGKKHCVVIAVINQCDRTIFFVDHNLSSLKRILKSTTNLKRIKTIIFNKMNQVIYLFYDFMSTHDDAFRFLACNTHPYYLGLFLDSFPCLCDYHNRFGFKKSRKNNYLV